MVPEVFRPYQEVTYPCYFLDHSGQLYLNGAAENAGPPLSDAKAMARLLQGAARKGGRQGGAANTLPLLADALSMRVLTLVPMKEGLLALALLERDAPVYAVSSQMREHLTNIFAVLPLLAKRLEDMDLRYTEEIQQNCYNLLRLASNLENAGCVGRHGFDIKPVDLVALTSSLCFCVDTVCSEQAVRFEWHLPKQLMPVRADARLLCEAFLNLIRNSLQYTRDGNRITVRLKEVAGQAVLTVADRGLGIRPESLERMFEPYFSADPYGDCNLRPGIGLGLSVVRETVQQFGGSVKVHSRFGEGTTVTLALPLDSGGEAVLDSASADYLLNRYSPVYVQLSGYCRVPGL